MERALQQARLTQVVMFPSRTGTAAAAALTLDPRGISPAEGAPIALHAWTWRERVGVDARTGKLSQTVVMRR